MVYQGVLMTAYGSLEVNKSEIIPVSCKLLGLNNSTKRSQLWLALNWVELSPDASVAVCAETS